MTKYLGYISVFLCDLRFTNTNNDTKVEFRARKKKSVDLWSRVAASDFRLAVCNRYMRFPSRDT